MSSSSVKVFKEFSWDADGRDTENARREIAVVDATGRKDGKFRVTLENT